MKSEWTIKILDTIDQLVEVEDLQRIVWPGSETDIVPAHLLITAVHNGGFVLGAFPAEQSGARSVPLVGFAFGFPGIYATPDGPRLKHCSHILAVHPEFRSMGLGFKLKRAQWQLVRKQGVDRITWTYDPLLSRNAHLNITRLGAVCNTYRRDVYGAMRDGLNIGLASDRFEVDWWVNSQRVQKRLSARVRSRLDLTHYLSAGAEIVNPAQLDEQGWVVPVISAESTLENIPVGPMPVILLIEIPSDFLALKDARIELAKEWRSTTRILFEGLFKRGYLVTDFVHLAEKFPRSYYVFSHGDGTL
jgi:predicted GNAT superfamily acetyltransferase